MGLFPGFDEQVPEPGESIPRKTGFARLWQLASRDLWRNFLAGFLALLGCAPFAAGVVLSVAGGSMPLAPLCGLVGGAVAGPELCALADTLLRGLRDDVGRAWWPTYRRAWRYSAKAALLPGALGGALLASQIFTLLHAQALAIDLVTSVALVLGMTILMGLSLYLWPQLALMELPFPQLLKNSVLLFIGQLPRSAAALALWAAYILLSLRFFSAALSLLPVANLWLPALPALFLVYPGLDQAFQIEEKLRDAA